MQRNQYSSTIHFINTNFGPTSLIELFQKWSYCGNMRFEANRKKLKLQNINSFYISICESCFYRDYQFALGKGVFYCCTICLYIFTIR